MTIEEILRSIRESAKGPMTIKPMRVIVDADTLEYWQEQWQLSREETIDRIRQLEMVLKS